MCIYNLNKDGCEVIAPALLSIKNVSINFHPLGRLKVGIENRFLLWEEIWIGPLDSSLSDICVLYPFHYLFIYYYLGGCIRGRYCWNFIFIILKFSEIIVFQ